MADEVPDDYVYPPDPEKPGFHLREPVGLAGLIEHGLILLLAGVLVFDLVTLNEAQYGWILSVVAFVGLIVTFVQRQNAYAKHKVDNEFLDAERVIQGK